MLARTAAFLLLKDSRSSYAIEGEYPPQDRIQRWDRAIGEAGRQPLDHDELLRLQRIFIGDTRFIKLVSIRAPGWGRRRVVGPEDLGTHEAISECGPYRNVSIHRRFKRAFLNISAAPVPCSEHPIRLHYRPTKATPKIDPRFSEPIKAMIEREPSFGYRTVAWLLGLNKNTVQRVFQLKGSQVRKRPVGMRPRIEAIPSVAKAPNERWSTDMCRVWAGQDGWATLALVIDCHTRELLGWHLSRSGKATTAASALEHALISRFGTLGRVNDEFLLRSDNGLVFTSRKFTALVRSYGLKQEFITPHCPQQNGMVERVIRTLKEQCVHRQRFDSIQHATRAIGDWISFYNNRRPHQALAMRTPAEAFRLAA